MGRVSSKKKLKPEIFFDLSFSQSGQKKPGGLECVWLYHDSGKVDWCDSIEDDENVVVVEPGEAIVESGREEEGEDLEIKVEWRPGRGLMLRHGGNDGNVVLGTAGVQQGIEATGPRSDLARKGHDADTETDDGCHGQSDGPEQVGKVLLAHVGLQVVDKAQDLTEAEHAERLEDETEEEKK